MKTKIKQLVLAAGVVILGVFFTFNVFTANAEYNVVNDGQEAISFQMDQESLTNAYAKSDEGKCGEGKCGEGKSSEKKKEENKKEEKKEESKKAEKKKEKSKKSESKCGEGKCG